MRLRYNYKDPDTGEVREILIENTETRSQLDNRENAMRLLRSQLYDMELQRRMAEQAKIEAGKKKSIEIGTEIAEDVKVSTDGELLSLVWNNLFSNAFKFTPEGGKVTLVLEATEHHAIVKVRDTGCGISPEVGAHIFEKLARKLGLLRPR